MVYKKTFWKDVYKELKGRILSGKYGPGSDFLTNKEIGEEFDIHGVSVQTAVNELIREGLVIPSSRKGVRRTVRTTPLRSKRKGGFTIDAQSAQKAHKELIELKIITDQSDLPEEVAKTMKAPVLYYHHNQFVDDTLVANSQSYIPNIFPLEELERRLNQEGARLYKSLEALGHKPDTVEEALISSAATQEDNELLNLPEDSRITVTHIDRKVFDADGNIVEYCYLTDRADCYIFEYRFKLY